MVPRRLQEELLSIDIKVMWTRACESYPDTIVVDRAIFLGAGLGTFRSSSEADNMHNKAPSGFLVYGTPKQYPAVDMQWI
jgi:hypothetical protein